MVKSTHTENRYAVCIGINVYAPSAGLSALRHAEDDARAMDIQLARLGFTDDNRKLLLGEAATLEAINAALEECILDRPHENDLVLFYFAGHGKPLKFSDSNDSGDDGAKGEVFLASYDFDASKIRQSRSFRSQRALGMKRLRETFFEGEGSRKRLFIFDSCYSGDFFGPRYRDDVADPVQGYIKYMLDSKSTGRLALSSCLPIQKAREDATLGHGLFTYHLLKALSGEDPDALRRDGWLTVNTLFEYIAGKLPEDQCPVLSGVQQDTFELVCYPHTAELEQGTGETQQERRRIEKDERLRIALTDHSAFLRNRLASFVGRMDELKDLGQRIQQLLPTGGYITITGQAGQGKSSIIAKLVEQRGVDQTAFHFIPLNPGPEHQVGLLRNLLARLILKYNLSDLYLASESRAALHDALLALLKEVTAKGGQEVIFIDGLDQLEEEQTGVRDLSFLPTNPPPGIVLVLGTRPNDALRPLELLKPHVTYPLPNLSRQDFDLILQHRGVSLSSVLADRFYEAMQQNALYLDLIAKELAEHDQQAPEELIQQLTENPERLFSLATDRFKRQWWLWRDLIKPILGLLLVVQEPLSKRHMRKILDVDADSLNKGLEHLGGLVIRDEQDRYSLYHLKFREFLQEDPSRPQKQSIFAHDEVEGWHLRVARWCEQSDIMHTWKDVPNDATEQGRRLYARQHYITHLYYARQWQALFAVLDAGTFGHAKLEHDPSMRSYTLDLTWGERAAAWENYSLEQGIDYLPVLWRYSLLRCRLVSRADSYPDEAFETMLLLGQSVKAVGIAELLTNPVRKVRALLHLARLLVECSGQHQEAAQLVKQAMVVASLIERPSDKDEALSSLASSLAQEQQWHEAERVIATIQYSYTQGQALSSLASSLAQAGEREAAQRTWHEAERVIATIQDSSTQAWALSSLASSLAQGQQWHEAERVIATIQDSSTQAEALSSLASSLAQGQQWHEAERVIATIQDRYTQAEALSSLASSLAQAHEWETLLGIIQRFWKSAKTQYEALSLFPLALNFFSTTPLLGKRFHEAFVWVDTFLRS